MNGIKSRRVDLKSIRADSCPFVVEISWDFFQIQSRPRQNARPSWRTKSSASSRARPSSTAESLEEIEAALIAADLGMAMTTQIVAAVKQAYETQGTRGP
jgi:signal recognition particle GTPase